ncbi:MAG TPA: hypothetical protein VHP30_01215, partial [Ignavibacteriales bacterium]|nr:hypothetical protein [Ignavibacteriales bacterium]
MFRSIHILFLLVLFSFAINAQNASILDGVKIKKEAASKNITASDFKFQAQAIQKLKSSEKEAVQKSGSSARSIQHE